MGRHLLASFCCNSSSRLAIHTHSAQSARCSPFMLHASFLVELAIVRGSALRLLLYSSCGFPERPAGIEPTARFQEQREPRDNFQGAQHSTKIARDFSEDSTSTFPEGRSGDRGAAQRLLTSGTVNFHGQRRAQEPDFSCPSSLPRLYLRKVLPDHSPVLQMAVCKLLSASISALCK